ncbi:cytochrome P450 family protein [Kibdelosporangium aridum]|uniref:cytochrome P450 family protein n=1 Tax=Kibdelosporangium aridum TaxID=2030 RepID=UPI00068EDF4F
MSINELEVPGLGTTWLVTGLEEGRAVLADPRLSRDERKAPDALRAFAHNHRADMSMGRHLLDEDPPDHTRLRGLIKKAFTPRRVENLRPRAQEITDALLDGLSGEVDLIDALAFPLPMTIMCELLGLPEADRADFRIWGAELAMGMDPTADRATVEHGGKALRAYFENLVAHIDVDDRPSDEQPDLTRALIRAGRMSHDELVSMLMLLLLAGHSTTVNLISNGMLALMTNPAQFALLRERPDLLPQAVEELVRHDGPLQVSLPRHTLEDVEISGVTIPAGSMVSVVVSAANRDASRFDDPDRLDITRVDNQHLGFGHGVHFCVGAALARMEAQVAIGSLVSRFPNMTLAVPEQGLRWEFNPMLRALASLPVRLG